MTSIKHTEDFNSQLDELVAAAKDFNKRYGGKDFSIECTGGDNPKLFITFTENIWSSGYTRMIQDICEPHGLKYGIVPLDGKLAITLSKQ